MGETAEDAKFLRGCGIATLGCGGLIVLCLVVGFGSLWYFGFVERGGVYDDLRGRLAQTQMTQLVPYIEMYRASHGVYPDNLEQVAGIIPESVPINVYDHSQITASRLYFYERVGEDNFILRSVGPDGIAFTEDDILPTPPPQHGGSGLLLERPAPPPAP